MKFFEIILLLIILYYLITKYVFPYLLSRLIQKVQQNFQQFHQENNPPQPRREGEIKVDYVPPPARKNDIKPPLVEDVDFEEIKDK